MRRTQPFFALLFAAGVVFGVAGFPAAAQSKGKTAQKSDRPTAEASPGPKVKPEQTSQTGEIVSLSCFLVEGEHGAGHRACAEACVKDGGPIALLTVKGDAFTIVRDPLNQNLDVASYLGKRVQVDGKLFKTTSSGSKALLVEKLKPVDNKTP
jgi:hypothetical protein